LWRCATSGSNFQLRYDRLQRQCTLIKKQKNIKNIDLISLLNQVDSNNNAKFVSYLTIITKGVKFCNETNTTLLIEYHYPSPLPKDLLDQCKQIFECNMAELYLSSSWGFDINAKQLEFVNKKARFLTVTQNDPPNAIVAFVHFRFEMNEFNVFRQEVLYIYEIQVLQGFRRLGIGKRLMTLLELVAMRSQKKKNNVDCI